ncbi:uncharacterized protein [Procambarus clarkii]|uniref:uncharacterized protein n=1 Tax=Procambarus clarkii TaxID=6728 RepID=UPI00374449D0
MDPILWQEMHAYEKYGTIQSGPRDYQVVKLLVHLGGYTSPLQAIVGDKIPSDLHVTGLGTQQTGPSLTQRLQDVLLWFRSGIYAYTADTRKAFLRVGLQEEDRDFTKFLWVKDPQDPDSEIITYRFTSVLFRATSSPFLLQITLDTHLKKSISPHKAEISDNLYVDNFLGTTNDENKLVKIYHEANRELLGANMPLQSWASNNQQLNEIIEKEFPKYQVLFKLKVLGMKWNTSTDELNVMTVKTNNSPLTMRKLLS